MKKFLYLLCYLKAIPFYIKTGVWCPHIYEEESREIGIVITTKNGFRVSDSLLHNANETIHPKATILRNKCVCCGHEDISWYDTEPYVIKTGE